MASNTDTIAPKRSIGRRAALTELGVGVLAAATSPAQAAVSAIAPQPAVPDLLPKNGTALRHLMQTLAAAPRRRDFKTVPMVLTDPDQWDHQALSAVIGYKAGPKQVWDNTDLGSAWLNLMRNALNTQVYAFKHPDFLAVSATHASAHLALYDQDMWDKYQLAQLAGEKFKTNTLIVDKPAAKADPDNVQDQAGVYSPADNSIGVLMRRGVVFCACHNAIWEQAARLREKDINPDKLSLEAMVAELTNHLLPGVVLTPGAVGTVLEMQNAGFQYAYSK